MRQMISGLVAAVAVMAAGAAPAMACGEIPCGPVYVQAPVYSGCYSGCGWAYERLPDPVQQYYYVNQGPTYTGPGNFAPYPVYREGPVYGWHGYRHRPSYYGYRYHGHYHHWHHHGSYGYSGHHSGYGPHHHTGYGYRTHTLRRYY